MKMRYKGTYYPQYVLDAQTYEWNLFNASLKRLMDLKRYVCLSERQDLEAIGNGAIARFNYGIGLDGRGLGVNSQSSSNNAVELEEEQNAEREESEGRPRSVDTFICSYFPKVSSNPHEQKANCK